MVALGTHQPLSEERILELYEISSEKRRTTFENTKFFNHRWDLEDTFHRIGYLTEEDTAELSAKK